MNKKENNINIKHVIYIIIYKVLLKVQYKFSNLNRKIHPFL